MSKAAIIAVSVFLALGLAIAFGPGSLAGRIAGFAFVVALGAAAADGVAFETVKGVSVMAGALAGMAACVYAVAALLWTAF